MSEASCETNDGKVAKMKLQEAATAERVAEIASVLFAGCGIDKAKDSPTDSSLLRMLARLKLEPPSFGSAWVGVVAPLAQHARKVCTETPRCTACPFISFCETGQRRVSRDNRPAAVDIFAGAGGLGRGFRDAGFRVALAIENERNAAQTYRLNNPGTPVFEMDVAKISSNWVQTVVGKRPEVVCAGPPCQSFSAAGPREDNDPRHHGFRHVLNLAHDLDPDVVLIENVPGIARRLRKKKNYRDVITEELGRRFEAEVLLLKATDYGVPQLRTRYIFLGRRRGTPTIGQPTKTHSTVRTGNLTRTPTVSEVLSGLPKRDHGCKKDSYKARNGRVIHNLTTMAHAKRVVARIKKIKGGEGPISYRRVSKLYARTIIAGHRALPVHPTLHRTMSVREAACIQSFPLDYVFLGVPSNQPLQVANAVPPPMAEAIARQLRKYLAKVRSKRRRKRGPHARAT